MRYAKIVSNDENNGRIVSAIEVRNGLVEGYSDFIDVEEEFRVTYVKEAKNHGEAYFRLYVSYEEYQSFVQEKKDRYDILKEMRHFQDGPWHRGWENKVRSFAEIEKYMKNEGSECKRADAVIENKKIVIEFQHSFIAGDFRSRNIFYSKLGYKVIWLFDVTQHDIVYEDGKYIILEDNARGLFKILNTNEDLSAYNVYAQAKDGKIYRIWKVYRKQINSDNLSTIRYFYTEEIYQENQFISYLINKAEYRTLIELCQKRFRLIVVFNCETGKFLRFCKDISTGKMRRQYDSGCMGYQYVTQDSVTGRFRENSPKFYSLKENDAKKAVWKEIKTY